MRKLNTAYTFLVDKRIITFISVLALNCLILHNISHYYTSLIMNYIYSHNCPTVLKSCVLKLRRTRCPGL